MPDHGVWCEVAVAEARERRRSSPLAAWKAILGVGAKDNAALTAALATVQQLPFEDLSAAVPTDDRNNSGKHVDQEDSIIGHLLALIPSLALTNRCCTFVDFCSGRGTLSERLSRVVGVTTQDQLAQAPPAYVLVDRARFKPSRCPDARMRASGLAARVTRIVASICSTTLTELQMDGPAFAFSKHACGPATDAILQCVEAFDSAASRAGVPTSALTIAPCES